MRPAPAVMVKTVGDARNTPAALLTPLGADAMIVSCPPFANVFRVADVVTVTELLDGL